MSPSTWFRLVALCMPLVVAASVLVPGRADSSEGKSRSAPRVERTERHGARVGLLEFAAESDGKKGTLISAPTEEDVNLTLEEGKGFTNGVGMKLVRIKAGRFLLGAPEEEMSSNHYERPQHEVEITKDFFIGVYEVTQKQYRAVMGLNPSQFRKDGKDAALVKDLNTDDFPVDNVSWGDAQDFLVKLNAQASEKSHRRVYRLPTEAEWEYCCRAGKKTRYHWGDDLSARDANFGDQLKRTCKVGSYRPNAWGLYDMHGNVDEWCADWYHDNTYQAKERTDPKGPKQPTSSRVQRGGNWAGDVQFCRSAFRNNPTPDSRSGGNGFRVVCVVLGQE